MYFLKNSFLILITKLLSDRAFLSKKNRIYITPPKFRRPKMTLNSIVDDVGRKYELPEIFDIPNRNTMPTISIEEYIKAPELLMANW
jgi:hypothetical protein